MSNSYYVIDTGAEQRYSDGADRLAAYKVKANDRQEAAYKIATKFTNGRPTTLKVIPLHSNDFIDFWSEITVS